MLLISAHFEVKKLERSIVVKDVQPSNIPLMYVSFEM